ncbi:MAG: polyprenyl synthetase family protein [Bacteroidetes bacterium]|nr:polyprenyl synthetase family protein [Bacteroidota bacterium]
MQHYSDISKNLETSIEAYRTKIAGLTPHELYDPLHYILSSGGKRIRPLLCLVGCDLFNKPYTKAIPAALAIELFHNFSLIHDDILDNAPLRRGKPTVHEKWNTNIAILSGDGMLVNAFEQLALAEKEHVKDLLALFSKTAMEVCEGQQFDMNFESQSQVSVDDYLAMITGKTAVLLGCSLQMGAICAGASKEEQNHLYEFGKHVGIAFQVLDDVLDVYAKDAGKFGKQVGGDIIANKKTWLLLEAFEKADGKQKERLKALLNMPATQATEKVNGVMALYDELGIRELALKEADSHTQNALQHLDLLEVDAEKKNHLRQLALHLLAREV